MRKGTRVLLLETVGRKSGRKRTIPLSYLASGEDLLLIASRAGSDFAPAWWLNLQAQPDTTVQVLSEHRKVHAREATPDERAILWPRVLAEYAIFRAYEQRTDRVIPVIILSPAE
jgi:deazaflavin-dependent oxidoreductase (nitroreductase family)